MGLIFDEPWWLVLAALAAPHAWIAWRWMRFMSVSRRVVSVVLRTAFLVLIAVMLAGASTQRVSDKRAIIAIVDVSDSVRRFGALGANDTSASANQPILERVSALLIEAFGAKRQKDLAGVVAFDGGAIATARPSSMRRLDLPLDFTVAPGTNIADAILVARAMTPTDASTRLLLISDGVQTSGDAERAAAATAPGDDGTPIDVVPLVYRIDREVIVERLDIPSTAPPGATITARVVLRSSGTASGTLRLLRDGEPLDLTPGEPGTGRRVRLPRGQSVHQAEIPLPASAATHRLRAVFEPDAPGDDASMTNNSAEALTLTPTPGRVLFINGLPQGAGGELVDTLERARLRVDVVSPTEVAADPFALQGYDLIIMQDVPADAVNQRFDEVLARYVTDLGGGLLVVGGRNSFAAGGWRGSALEPILPVQLELPEKVIVPSIAVMFVLDASGSMGASVMGSARSQQEIANEGAARAIESLDPRDLVGVIAFTREPRTVVPLSRNNEPEFTGERVRSIYPGGGTNLPPALSAATTAMINVEADSKHIIVLSDGRSDGGGLLDIGQRARDNGITITTIGVGDEADFDTLAAIARVGGGTFYQVIDPNVLPRIFLRAVQVVRSPLVRETPFTPVVMATGSPATEGVAAPPLLEGLALTALRDDPTVINPILSSEGEPLLSYWNAGVGRVAAFTSDATSMWARRWLDWPGYARLWVQVARLTARPPADRGAVLTTRIDGGTMRIRLDVAEADGAPADLLSTPTAVYAPSGEVIELDLPQVGPGQYEAEITADEIGAYVVTVTPRKGQKRYAPVLGAASRVDNAELRELRSDSLLLRRVAEVTGGRLIDLRDPERAGLYDESLFSRTTARLPVWPVLLPWVLAAALLDIGCRRVAWDRYFTTAFRQAARERERGSASIRQAVSRAIASRRSRDEPDERVFTQKDAQRIVREQAARRAAVRRKTGDLSLPPTIEIETEDKKEAEPRGLRAAKQRARRRYQQENEDG